MAWNIFAAIERHFLAAVLTVVTLGIAVGLALWIWSERFTRHVPSETELVKVSGLIVHAMAQPNSGVVWLDLKEARGPAGSLPEVTALRLYASNPQQLTNGLSLGPGGLAAVAWTTREELQAATSRSPASALQLRVGDITLIPYEEGRMAREDRALGARVSAWVAGAGVAVSLVVLFIFWAQRLRT